MFRGTARDQRQVCRFLRVAAEEHAPTAIRHAHDVVMAAMNV